MTSSSKKDTLTIGWCDNGTTDGKFTEGVMYTTLSGIGAGIPIVNAMRVSGNQIARQRQNLMDMWYDADASDWILWLDSDVVITADILKRLWNMRHATHFPLVSGVYMVTQQAEQKMPQPLPDVFTFTDDGYVLQYMHPLPYDVVVEADAVGFGCLLMHRSVVAKLREQFAHSVFYESMVDESRFVGEDITFFKYCKQAGIKLSVDTGAIVQHMKRFSFDDQYYYAYWSLVNAQQGEPDVSA